MTKNFRRFLFNGLLLTAVNLIMRGVGVSFNAYISNKIGAEAMGLYTLVMTVYGFAVTLATSGINLAATKLVSEALCRVSDNGLEQKNTKIPFVRSVMKQCIYYSLFFSVVATVILLLTAEPIGYKILRDSRTVASLKLLALTLIPISLSSALSGYFTAVRRIYKNAVTQVFGQLLRIYFCVFLLTAFFANDVESACVSIVLGGCIAEIGSFILQAIFYIAEKGEHGYTDPSDRKHIGVKLRGIALPVAFSAYVRSALITIEHILIPRGLEKSGATREHSLAAYGTVQSMVFPIVFFPSAILSSFASLLIPEVAGAKSAKEVRVTHIINRVFETALVYAIGTAGIMLFFSFQLGDVIYPNTEAGKYIKMIAPLIPVMYLDTATDALLKGLGEQLYSMVVNIVDSFLSVILVIILLPRFGITGYIITVYFTELINAALSITRLLTISKIRPNIVHLVIKPLISVICAACIVKHLTDAITFKIKSDAFSLIIHLILTALLYIMIFFALKGAKKIKKLQKRLEIRKAM